MTGFDPPRCGRLIVVTYVAGALLLVGVLPMLAAGSHRSSGGPALDLSSIVADIASLQPAGFLWLGLLAAIATPITRVIAAAIAFARAGETRMVGVAVAIPAVIAISVATALATG